MVPVLGSPAALLVSLWIGLGIVSSARSQVWQADETLWADAVQKAPGKPRPLINHGRVLETKGDIDGAIRYYQLAIAASFDDRRSVYTQRFTKAAAESNLGHILIKQEQYEAALRFLNQVTAEWPAFAPAHYNRAVALQMLGRCADALIEYQVASYLDPELPKGSCEIATTK